MSLQRWKSPAHIVLLEATSKEATAAHVTSPYTGDAASFAEMCSTPMCVHTVRGCAVVAGAEVIRLTRVFQESFFCAPCRRCSERFQYEAAS
ncbi:hypothetical protein MRX96_055830 [Rhipicephalus microplus]